VILDGKRILITGVVDHHSIAYAIAKQAQLQGAEILLTSFGRVRRLTERAATELPDPPEVLELDVTEPEDFAELRDELQRRWGGVVLPPPPPRSRSRPPTRSAATSSAPRWRARRRPSR
jgi:enoyl-[acyl-carrier-protein] reductase (NADH)